MDTVEGVGGPIQPIGITWEAAGVNDERWNAFPGCTHTAVHCDVLPRCVLLLVYVFPPSLAQDFFPCARLAPKTSLIAVEDQVGLVLQMVPLIEGLIHLKKALNGLWCSAVDSGSVQ